MSGTKVNDPHSRIQESAGPIASDSLAAESETFQSSNRNAEPLGVSGSNSTFANTNTSGAIELRPAHDASDRLTSADQQSKYPDGVGAQDKDAAVESTNRSSQNAVDSAPSYIGTTLHAADIHDGKPKGKNLNEVEDPAEFGRAQNASFTADIGSKDDPGRLAERDFERMDSAGVIAAGEPNKGVQEGTSFDALPVDESA